MIKAIDSSDTSALMTVVSTSKFSRVPTNRPEVFVVQLTILIILPIEVSDEALSFHTPVYFSNSKCKFHPSVSALNSRDF